MRKKSIVMALVISCFLFLALSPVMQAKSTVEWVDTDKFFYNMGEPVIITYHTMMHCLRGDITITNVWCQEVVYEPNPWIMGPCFFGPYDGELEWDQTYLTFTSFNPRGDAHNGEQVPPGLYRVEAGSAMAYFYIGLQATTASLSS